MQRSMWLTAKVQTVFHTLPENVQDNYGETLKQRFDPNSKKELYIMKLHTRVRHKGEDLASYRDDLADKAFGDMK